MEPWNQRAASRVKLRYKPALKISQCHNLRRRLIAIRCQSLWACIVSLSGLPWHARRLGYVHSIKEPTQCMEVATSLGLVCHSSERPPARCNLFVYINRRVSLAKLIAFEIQSSFLIVVVSMALLKHLILAVSAATCALSLPSSNVTGEDFVTLPKRSGTPSSAGVSADGFYDLWWTDYPSDGTYTSGPGVNTFTVRWNDRHPITAGKGWNPGYSGR